METFGDRFKKAFAGHSKAAISRKLGLSYQAVKNYANGRLPDAVRLKDISKATGCSIHWLVTGEGAIFVENLGVDVSNIRESIRMQIEENEDLLESIVQRLDKLGSLEDEKEKQANISIVRKKLDKMALEIEIEKEMRELKNKKEG